MFLGNCLWLFLRIVAVVPPFKESNEYGNRDRNTPRQVKRWTPCTHPDPTDYEEKYLTKPKEIKKNFRF
jgi:hypothetical protein